MSIDMGNNGSKIPDSEKRKVPTSDLLTPKDYKTYMGPFVYIFNAVLLMALLVYIVVMQAHGHYRCNTISVVFDEEIWENVYVKLNNGIIEERLLIYSYFNGVYKGKFIKFSRSFMD